MGVNIIVPDVLPFKGSLLNDPAILVEVSPTFVLNAKGCDIKPSTIKS